MLGRMSFFFFLRRYDLPPVFHAPHLLRSTRCVLVRYGPTGTNESRFVLDKHGIADASRVRASVWWRG